MRWLGPVGRCCVLLLVCCCAPQTLLAQQPLGAEFGLEDFDFGGAVQFSIQDDAAAGQPLNQERLQEEDDVPLLPETPVPGRPGAFPAEPLTEGEVVTPNRGASAAGEYGGSVTVIDQQQIAQSQQSSVAEVLRSVPGLDVVRAGGPGGITSVFLRGANSAQTKVLLDGMPINDPSGATRAFDFSTLNVDNIERIEVLRGPQSMLYGSDAIGGVINIITKRGEGPATVTAGSMGGSFGTAQQTLGVSGGDANYYYSLSGAFLHTDGISAATERAGNTERDRFQNGTVSGRFGWTPSETLNVDYVFRYIDSAAEVDSFLPPTFVFTDDPLRENLSTQFFNRLQFQSIALDGAVEQRVGLNLTDYAREDTAPGPFDVPEFFGQTRMVDYTANLFLHETNTLTAGVDYLQEDASSTFVTQQMQNNLGVYVQDEVRLADRFFATAGFRWDDHSAAGPAQTYRFTARHNFLESGTALHGALGTGFRAPALAQNFFVGGNPALRPERSKGWEAGIEQQLFGGDVVLDATYFRNDFVDLIDFDFLTFMLRNIGRARANGVETTVLWRVDDCTSLSGNYTLTDTRDIQFGGALPRRPQQKASLGVSRDLLSCRARVNLYVLFVGDRLDLPLQFGGGVLNRYTVVNLSGNYQLADGIELFARIDNLLDRNYEEAAGFGAPGIAGFGGVNFLY